MEIKKIETYSLFEFCDKTQQAILDGWRFDLESNENAPTAFGSMLIAGMVKDTKIKEKSLDNTAVNTIVLTPEDTQVKRGRKPKDNI